MSDELEVAERWIRSALLASTAITDYVGDRIFDLPPPRGTLYPYIVFNTQSAEDVRGVGTQRIMSDSIYTVKAVAETDDSSKLAPLAGAIDDALVLASPVSVGTIGTALACVRERLMRYTELTDGTYYSHRGGEYRILTQVN